MRIQAVILGIGAVAAFILIAIPVVLAPGSLAADKRPVPAIDGAEQAAIVDAMRPPKRERPVIAIATRNEATEVSDFLSIYGVLRRADVADVTVLAERAEPVHLYPTLTIQPEATMSAFDQRYPDGADYVVVPAMDPGNDPFVARWIAEQYRKGAKIVSVCKGSLVLATAGLLEGRRATTHWSAVADLQKAHPTMRWVKDRRYVSDRGVTTSTGITANIPTMLALIEAIAGYDRAKAVADELGVASWDARHRSSSFDLTLEHKKTFIRNAVSLWRHQTLGIPVGDDVDEVSLGLMVDAYSRTGLSKVVTLGEGGKPIQSRNGLTIVPDKPVESAAVDEVLDAPPSDAPATVLERELPRIATHFDNYTAAIVALVMEYPRAMNQNQSSSR